MVQRLAALALTALFLSWCSSDAQSANGNRPIKIAVLGDSLSAGFGLLWDPNFPEQLEQTLRAKGIPVTIVNAGVSGDTTSDGLRRLDRSVPADTEAVIIELGANDAERGINPDVTEAALGSILQRLRERHIQVLLTGIRPPPSRGPAYGHAFAAIYSSLASAYSFVWYPDILDGVEGNSALIQLDGEHPNAAGVNTIVERILPQVEELIARVRAGRTP